MSFKFLELKELPKIEKKPKVSISEQILRDFLKRDTKYGAYELESRAKARGVARRINMVIKRLNLAEKIAYRGMEENKIYLERLDIE